MNPTRQRNPPGSPRWCCTTLSHSRQRCTHTAHHRARPLATHRTSAGECRRHRNCDCKSPSCSTHQRSPPGTPESRSSEMPQRRRRAGTTVRQTRQQPTRGTSATAFHRRKWHCTSPSRPTNLHSPQGTPESGTALSPSRSAPQGNPRHHSAPDLLQRRCASTRHHHSSECTPPTSLTSHPHSRPGMQLPCCTPASQQHSRAPRKSGRHWSAVSSPRTCGGSRQSRHTSCRTHSMPTTNPRSQPGNPQCCMTPPTRGRSGDRNWHHRWPQRHSP